MSNCGSIYVTSVRNWRQMSDSAAQARSRAAFAYAGFSGFMAARFLNTVAAEMQSVAVGWQIYNITHRALDLGLVGLAQFLPSFCLFLIAGQTADRYSRLRILRFCYLGFTLCSALFLTLTLNGVRNALPIYVVLVFNGVLRAFNGPASSSIIPSLVPTEVFANAVAWGSSIFQTATIVGPVLGGVLYGISNSPTVVYSLAGLATLAGFAFLTLVTMPATSTKALTASAGMLFDGIRYIWRNRLLLGAVSLDLFAVLLGGAVALLPVFAEDILKGGAIALGILRSAPGIGAVLMGVAIAHMPIRQRAGRAMLFCVALYGVFTIVFGISRNLLLSTAALLLAGAADTISVIVRHTLIQLATPDEMRGRVSAVNMIFIGASNELGQFESGLTAHWFGTVPAVILGGVGTLAVVGLWTWMFPSIRQLDRLETIEPVELVEEPAAREAGIP